MEWWSWLSFTIGFFSAFTLGIIMVFICPDEDKEEK